MKSWIQACCRWVVAAVFGLYGVLHAVSGPPSIVGHHLSAIGWWTKIIPIAPLLVILLLFSSCILLAVPVRMAARRFVPLSGLLGLTVGLVLAFAGGASECGCGGDAVSFLSLSMPWAIARNILLVVLVIVSDA